MSILLAVTASCAWGLSTIFAGPGARRGSALAITLWSQLSGLVMGLPVLIFAGLAVTSRSATAGALAGCGSGVSLLFLYASTRRLFVGVASALSAIVALVIPEVYSAVTHPLSIKQYVGLACCVVALLGVANVRRANLVRPGATPAAAGMVWTETVGIGMAVLSGVAMSLYYIALAGSSATQQIGEALESRLVATCVLTSIGVISERSVFRPDRSAAIPIIGTGATGIIGALAYAVAVRSGTLALIVPIVTLSPAVTIALARMILGERLARRQLSGLVLAIAGVLLVTT